MARHTIICAAGRRIDIQPSKTTPGLVQVQILGADRQVMASCTVDANAAAVLSLAFDIEAHAAAEISNAAARVVDRVEDEKAVQCCAMPSDGCMGMLLPSIGDKCSALLGVRRVGPAMVQAYADTNGVPPAQVERVPGWGAGLETAYKRAVAGA